MPCGRRRGGAGSNAIADCVDEAARKHQLAVSPTPLPPVGCRVKASSSEHGGDATRGRITTTGVVTVRRLPAPNALDLATASCDEQRRA
jgi:hypothetical protein